MLYCKPGKVFNVILILSQEIQGKHRSLPQSGSQQSENEATWQMSASTTHLLVEYEKFLPLFKLLAESFQDVSVFLGISKK